MREKQYSVVKIMIISGRDKETGETIKKAMSIQSQAFSICNNFGYYIKEVRFVLRDIKTGAEHDWSGQYSIFETVERRKRI